MNHDMFIRITLATHANHRVCVSPKWFMRMPGFMYSVHVSVPIVINTHTTHTHTHTHKHTHTHNIDGEIDVHDSLKMKCYENINGTSIIFDTQKHLTVDSGRVYHIQDVRSCMHASVSCAHYSITCILHIYIYTYIHILMCGQDSGRDHGRQKENGEDFAPGCFNH